MKKQAKFGIGIGVIVVSMGFLAWLGYGESKTYYHTIAELGTLQGDDIFLDYLPQENHATISHMAIYNAFLKLYTATAN